MMNKIKTAWDLTTFFQNIDDPQILVNLGETRHKNLEFINKWNDRKDYLEDPKVLTIALSEYEKLGAIYGVTGNTGYYAGLALALDQANPKIKALEEHIEEVAVDVINKIKFFEERVAKIPEEKHEIFLSHAELSPYKHYLETLFRDAKYLLSEGEEKIVNILSSTSYSRWVDMTTEFLSVETAEVKNEVRSFSEITDLISDQDKGTRDEAAEKFNTILLKHRSSAEHEVNAILKYKKEMDKLRGYERPDTARHLSDDMETSVVDTLIDSVKESFDISQRYYELKARLMGTSKLGYHERNVEIGHSSSKYSFEEALNYIFETLSPLDSEFSQILEDMSEAGRIDAYPKPGKSGGAFCTHNLKNQPIFILLNYTGRLDDIVALAHETGHAIHFELAKKAQNSLNLDTSLATAEVASTFMEDFALRKVAGNIAEEEKLWLLSKKLDELVSSVQRQTACYLFEKELHEQYRKTGYLSHKEIGELFLKHMKAYMGDFVSYDAGSENWWVYWSHIRTFFYVYSYSSGVLISMAIQNMVAKDIAKIGKLKEFLSAGSSDYPSNIFKKMGIDIESKDFWDSALSQERSLLDETWNLAKKLGKL